MRQVREGAVWIGRGLDRPSFVQAEDLPLCRQERFLWYSSRSRYPVAEVELTTHTASTGEIVGRRRDSRLCPPSLQDYETRNPYAPRRDKPSASGSPVGLQTGHDSLLGGLISGIDVTLAGDYVRYSYSLSGTAEVEAMLCDTQGRVYAETSRNHGEASTHIGLFPVSNLPSGVYLIVVSAGKERQTKRFYKK